MTSVNEAPTDISPDSFAIPENTDTTSGYSVGVLTATDEDSGETFSYTIVGGVDAAMFSIGGSGDELILTDGVLDYESKSSYDVIVRVTDSFGNTYDENLAVNISDLNEAPTDISPNIVSIDENIDTTGGQSIASLTAADEDAGETFSYSVVGGADAANFSIGGAFGDELIFDGGVLDYETKSSFTVTVRVTDSGGLTYDETLTVNVNNLNEVPVDIAPSVLTVDENIDSTSGYSLGQLTASDPDGGTIFSYSIVGGIDAGKFSIGGPGLDELILIDGILNYENQSTYDVMVRVTDPGGLTYDESLVVNVNDLNEAPVINDQLFSITENSSNGTSVGFVLSSDVDFGDSANHTIVGGTGASAFGINGLSGEIVVADVSQLDFETTPFFSLIIEVVDSGGLSDTATITIGLNDVNDEQILTTNLPLAVLEGASGVIDGALLLTTDQDHGPAVLTYTVTMAPANGILTVGGVPSLTFTQDDVNSGQLAYVHDGSETTADSFDFVVDDGVGVTSSGSFLISIAPVNDSPVANDDGFVTNEGDTYMGTSLDLLGNDFDSDSPLLTASLVAGPAHGTLNLNPDGSFTYTHDGSETISDSFQYRISDGVADSSIAFVNITIVPANDAPIGTGDTYSTMVGTTLTELIGVLANDTDAEFDSITAVLTSTPANGTILLNPDGSFSYTPNSGFVGVDSFSYVANDGVAFGNQTVVTINVAAGVEPPTVPPVQPPPVDPPPVEEDSVETESTADSPVDDQQTPLITPFGSGSELERREINGEFNYFEPEELESYLGVLTDRKQAEAVLRLFVDNTASELILDADEIRRLELQSSIGVAFDATYLWKQLDELSRPDTIFNNFEVSLGAITSIGTLGYIFWSLRGGALVALALSQFPTWRMIDPLPVLESYSFNHGKTEEDGMKGFF